MSVLFLRRLRADFRARAILVLRLAKFLTHFVQDCSHGSIKIITEAVERHD